MSAREPSPNNNNDRGRPVRNQASRRWIFRWLASSSQAVATALRGALPARWHRPSKRVSISLSLLCLSTGIYIFHRHHSSSSSPPWSPWLIDSTTQFHTTNDKRDFSLYAPLMLTTPLHSATAFNGVPIVPRIERWDVVGTGIVYLEIRDREGQLTWNDLDVLYVPSVPKRLSLGTLLGPEDLEARRTWIIECSNPLNVKGPLWSLTLDASNSTYSVRARVRTLAYMERLREKQRLQAQFAKELELAEFIKAKHESV